MLPPRFVYRHYVIVRHQDNGSGCCFFLSSETAYPCGRCARAGTSHVRGGTIPAASHGSLQTVFHQTFPHHNWTPSGCAPAAPGAVQPPLCPRRRAWAPPQPRLRFEPGRTDAQHGAQRQHSRKYEPADHKNSSVLLDMACFHHTTSRQKKGSGRPLGRPLCMWF